MNEYEESVILCGIHSLIASNIPTQLPLKSDVGKEVKDQSKFGFFSDPPSFQTYYPEVKPEDFTGKDEDYIQPVFRMLSNTVVISNRGLIEFPEDVLKASVGLMVGQAVYPNHDQQVGNELGAVVDTVWQDSYKVNGKKIPAGINARMKIDAKSHPTIARGINMDPPSIHSVSCTVVYRWKKSHEFEHDYEFYEKMGTYDEKGNLVRKIATEILYFTELSFVPHGADPFAKKLDDKGHIVLPDFAKAQSVNVDQTNFAYNVDWRNLDSVLDVESVGTVSSFNGVFKGVFKKENLQTDKKNVMTLDEIISLASQVLGITGLTTENFKASLESFKASKDNLVDPTSLEIGDVKGFDQIKEKFTAMETELGELRALKEKESFIQAGEEHLNEVRAEAVNFYKLSLGEGVAEDEAIVNLINAADIKAAKAMLAQYKGMVDKDTPLTCQDCGGHNFSRASFKKEEDKDDKNKENKAKSFQELREEFIYRRDFKRDNK